MRPQREDYSALLSLGVPIIVGQIGMIVMGFADTLMIGRHSTAELASAGFVNNVVNLLIIVGSGFSYGLTPVVGSLFGKGETGSIGAEVKNALAANLLLALLMMLIYVPVYLSLGHMGQPSELLPLIRPYFLLTLASVPIVMAFNAFRQFADSITDTSLSMWILLWGNAANILGNYLLIYGKLGLPEMGLAGAGVSTFISRLGMLIAIILAFFHSRRYDVYKKSFVSSHIVVRGVRRLIGLGAPIAAQSGMETFSFTMSAVMAGWIGATALASHQVMITIANMTFMTYYGMGAAVSIRVSHYVGRGERFHTMSTARAGHVLMLCITAMVVIPILLMRESLGGLFNDNPEVISGVASLVIPFSLYQLGDGLQINYANALRGMADVKVMMYIAFVAYFMVGIPAAYVFGFVFHWGIVGVWLGFPFGLSTAGILYKRRFFSKVAV